MFARIFEYKFASLNQAKIAANHISMELGDKIEKFNINSLSSRHFEQVWCTHLKRRSVVSHNR